MYTLRIINENNVTANFYLGNYYEVRHPLEKEKEDSPNAGGFITASELEFEICYKTTNDAFIMSSDGKTFECLNRKAWHDQEY